MLTAARSPASLFELGEIRTAGYSGDAGPLSGHLGLGVAPPTAEWGAMIAAGRRFMLDQWWVAAAPGVAIAVATLGFNLLGEGLRDVLDPRQR